MNQFKIKKNNEPNQNNQQQSGMNAANEAFKKNKDHKIFQNNFHEGQQIPSSKNLGETQATNRFMDEGKIQSREFLKDSRLDM